MHFIRHGQSEFNFAMNRVGRDPQIPDAPLTSQGMEQARQAAIILKNKKITHVIASPYTRALQTASIIARELNLEIQVEPLVGERSIYSCDLGTPASLLKMKWPDLDFSALVSEKWWPDSGETHGELALRVRAFHKKWHGTDTVERVALVSHWYFLNTLTGYDFNNGEVLYKPQLFHESPNPR